MDKHGAAHVLEQIAAFLELKGENEFRVRAFRNAAHAVEDYGGDFAAALASGALGDVKGIGPATLDVLREWAAIGRSSALESLKHEVPGGLVEMLRIAGLGVTKVRALHQQLGITSITELETAAHDGRIAALPRFGEKTAERILRGIEFLRRTSDLHLFHHAQRQAEQLRRAILAMPGVIRSELAGSVRRRCELIRDIDLAVAATGAPGELADKAGDLTGVRDVVGTGEAAFTVHLDDGQTCDVYVAPPGRFGNVLCRATGNAAHVEQLREVARARGVDLDGTEFGDEWSLYEALGLAFVPPELREGRGEVLRAARGPLPRLLERHDLAGFLHCHTVYSDGTNSVAEMAEACRAEGYRYVGITDHSVAAAFAGGLTEEVIARQHAEIDALNATSRDIRVLKGIEADILERGALDYTPAFLDRFDFVIGSIHARYDMDEKTMTARVLRAIDDPHLAIIGHPTGRLLLEREPYAIDMHAVIRKAAERGVAIEINADPQRLDLDWRLCGEAQAAGVPIPIGADAHSIAGLANADIGVGIARKAGLTRDDVLNARDLDGFLDHVARRKRRRG
jgi:DNA polymerase (family 10)